MKLVFTLFAVCVSFYAFSQEKPYNDAQNMAVTVDQEAHFPEGEMAMYQYIYQNIKWPALTAKVFDETMMLSFNVLTDSTTADIEIMSGVEPSIDKAVIDVLKKMKFAPSVQLGTPIKMNLMINIPIRKRFE
ncbi:MAG: energy transducer TonB [Bacteroidota bacterium]